MAALALGIVGVATIAGSSGVSADCEETNTCGGIAAGVSQGQTSEPQALFGTAYFCKYERAGNTTQYLAITKEQRDSGAYSCPAKKDKDGNAWTGVKMTGTGSGIIDSVINTILYIVGIAAVIMIIVGGIRYATSAGNEKSVTGAKNTIIYALIGLAAALLAWVIVNFVVTSL